MNKKIFISYSDQDQSRMRSLERIIKKSSHFVAIIIADRRDALISLTEKVKRGIYESDYVVPIITEKSMNTQWINQEIGFSAALNKQIIPIVEDQVITKLKGFIHKNIDLPYKFTEKSTPKATRSGYRKVCDLLINDLLIKNNYSPNSFALESVFSGQWKSMFSASHINGTEFPIEIKDGNKYFAKGVYWFNIENFRLNSDRTKISFVKVGLGDDKRRIKNDLIIRKLGSIYEGTEVEEHEGLPINIIYSRLT